jgi:hypothetical protein
MRGIGILVAGLACLGLGSLAVAGILQPVHRDVAYLSLAVTGGEPLPDTAVRLHLQVDNARDEPLAGQLVITAAPPGAAASDPAAELWTGDITAPGRLAGPVTVEVPDACGVRLRVVVRDDADERSVSTLVPCQPGSTLRPTLRPGASP